MPDYLKDYKEYYQVRADKFANNNNYKFSYQAEKNLSDAMQSCQELEEFRSKVGDLPLKCASALVKDESLMEQAHYNNYEEPYRKMYSDILLSQVDSCEDANAIITLALEASEQANKAIISDEYQRIFIDYLRKIDDIEIYSKAIVPDSYRAKFDGFVTAEKELMLRQSIETQAQYRLFAPDWVEHPDTCKESRHRRLIPLNEEHFLQKLELYKSIINK